METQLNSPFRIIPGMGAMQPLIISIPHVGVLFPDEVRQNYLSNQVEQLDDTDWFLDQLYDFAPDIGITVIAANYSRWLIDLNRDPESAPLYSDGRLITGLTSTTDFLGNPIYKAGCEPDKAEVDRRLARYYWPYYQQIQRMLEERRERFKNVVLWDAHSIRQFVPSIRNEKFPEMILGNADETSADGRLIDTALTMLRKGYDVNHNDPFKGGHITRYFGKPGKGIHALQLERNKILYMDDNERNYDSSRADKMKIVLKNTLLELLTTLKSMEA